MMRKKNCRRTATPIASILPRHISDSSADTDSSEEARFHLDSIPTMFNVVIPKRPVYSPVEIPPDVFFFISEMASKLLIFK